MPVTIRGQRVESLGKLRKTCLQTAPSGRVLLTTRSQSPPQPGHHRGWREAGGPAISSLAPTAHRWLLSSGEARGLLLSPRPHNKGRLCLLMAFWSLGPSRGVSETVPDGPHPLVDVPPRSATFFLDNVTGGTVGRAGSHLLSLAGHMGSCLPGTVSDKGGLGSGQCSSHPLSVLPNFWARSSRFSLGN